jgi:hypothetical protein
MDAAKSLQLPFVEQPASKTGRRVFVKQILPIATVRHPKHGALNFTRERLAQIVERFKAGAMDLVPFLLATKDNAHHDDVERMRGEVEDLELTDKGLFAKIRADRQGAKLLADFPKLPVSVRLKPEDDGEVLAHVLATPDPVVKGMAPWQAVEASADDAVLDFASEGSWYKPGQMAGKDATAEQGKDAQALSEEEVAKFRDLLSKLPDAEKKNGEDDEEPTEEEQREAQRLLNALLAEAEKPGDEDGEEEEGEEEEEAAEAKKTPVAASLDKTSRKALELAQSQADSATRRVSTLETELAKQRFERIRDDYIREGVPPALVEMARPVLELPDEGPIELSSGSKVDARKVLTEVLDAAKDTIDFSERGSALSADDDEQKVKERDEFAKAWMEANA